MVTVKSLKSRCKVDLKTGCWNWVGCVQSNGYARVRVGKRIWYVHRLMWTLVHGAIRKGFDVCHHCDNRPCANPDHLFMGTRKQNMRDAKDKGRLSAGLRHSLAILGAFRAHAKLSMDKAIEVRQRLLDGEKPASLADEFGVDVSNIRYVRSNRIWKDRRWLGLI